jgi:hypothetical protein
MSLSPIILSEASTAAQIGREVRVRAEISVRHRRVFGIGGRRQLRPTVEIVGRSFSSWCSCYRAAPATQAATM